MPSRLLERLAHYLPSTQIHSTWEESLARERKGCYKVALCLKPKFLDLGMQPIANGFLKQNQLGKEEYTFNLSVGICSETFLVSLMDFVDPPKMFNENYPFHTSASPVNGISFQENV